MTRHKDKEHDLEEVLEIFNKFCREDPLLLPYFEKEEVKLVNKAEDDFIAFTPGLPAKTKKFLRERISIALGIRPDFWEKENLLKWEERERLIDEMRDDDVLWAFLSSEAIRITNTASVARIEFDASVPEKEREAPLKRLMEIIADDWSKGFILVNMEE